MRTIATPVLTLCLLASAAPQGSATTVPTPPPAPARVNLGTGDVQAADALFGAPSISADGSRVAFASAADNLVADDDNGEVDVFVRDRAARTTVRASVSSLGLEGLGASLSPVISADGRFVAFTSYAPNLVLGDLNGVQGAGSDVFVHDLRERTTVRVSASALGVGGNGESDFASISADGRFVAFDSTAPDLVPGDTNGAGDVFVWDRTDSSLRRVSVAADGAQGDAGSGLAAIDADGSHVAFVSKATALVPGDTNDYADAFVVDLSSGAVRRVNLDSQGRQAQGDADAVTLSGDGRTAAVVSAWPLTAQDRDFSFDVYTVDLATGRIRLASSGAAGSGVRQPPAAYGPALSHDGRRLAFASGEGDPTPAGPPPGSQVYLRDLDSDDLRLVSTPAQGVPDDTGHAAAISADGQHVAFASTAQNLVPFDNNHASDAFVLDLGNRRYEPGGPTSMPRDVFPPDTRIASGPPLEPAPGPARFAFAADETPVSYECRLDADPQTVEEDEGWSTCPTEHAVAAEPGEHLLEVRAVDWAGNPDPSPVQRVFTLAPQSP